MMAPAALKVQTVAQERDATGTADPDPDPVKCEQTPRVRQGCTLAVPLKIVVMGRPANLVQVDRCVRVPQRVLATAALRVQTVAQERDAKTDPVNLEQVTPAIHQTNTSHPCSARST